MPTDGAEATRVRVNSGSAIPPTEGFPRADSEGRVPLTLVTPAEAVPEGTSGRRSRLKTASIDAFSLLLAGGAAVLLTVGPLSGLGPDHHLAGQPVMFGLLFASLAAAVWGQVSFHYRGSTYMFSLAEVPLLLGLVFASPPVLVISYVAALVAVFGLVRRQAPSKLLFNAASGAFASAVAATVFRQLLETHSPVSPFGWVAGAAALAVFTLAATEAVRLVLRLNGQKAHREFMTEVLLFMASIGLAFVVLDAAWWDPWSTLPLVLVAALIVFAYRGYTRLSLRFGALQRLYDFSRSLGDADLEPAGTSWAVLEQIRTVMRARRSELILAEASGIPRRISLDPVADPTVEPLVLDESSIVTQAMLNGAAVLHGRQRGATDTGSRDSILGDFREALVAPLLDGDTVVGALVALDREEELDPFDTEDLRLFEALAVHAGSSLDRARLIEELHFEVDSKSHQATHDTLTGLPNRTLFLSRAQSALSDGRGMAIALLDLDRFKDVNDTLGHAVGDRLLCEVSERLVHVVSGRATVARLGGDEFALVLPEITAADGAIAILRELNAELSKPIEIDSLTFAVTASAGLALAPEHGENVTLLLQRADIAMYLAKERRSGIELYSVGRDQSMQRKLMLGGLLVHALETGNELSLKYQPIADLGSGQVVRVEALARWHHPVHGWIPTPEFIEIAEQMGIIGKITEFVLTEACARLAEWRRAGLQIGLAVNLSGRDLSDEHLIDRVAQHLRANGLPAQTLTLELTETEVMADLGHAGKVLNELADLGIGIAVDDYGTGYSSLAYLHRLPVKELKIDRSFVTNLAEDPSNAIIVRSSITMAHSLGLGVVAEGAEDEVTCKMLADAGCDLVQGYYLSRPQEPARLRNWLLGGASLELSSSLTAVHKLRSVVNSRGQGSNNGGPRPLIN
ncbi:MAG: EAL domain-containing protein [Acidimicrobiales bacterium]